MASNSTERFGNRADDYIRYRPHYPALIVAYLQQQYGLLGNELIADIGAGTGISSALFLDAGYAVTAVEPNEAMRSKAVELLGKNSKFKAADGTAEDTGLAEHSIRIIVAGQAFHWFDAAKAKREFLRILQEDGIVVLIWNERMAVSPFEKAYDTLIGKHGRDYIEVKHRNIAPYDLKAFFSPAAMEYAAFENYQDFDFDGLKGRLTSSSYMPATNDDGYESMIVDLHALFEQHQQGGQIRINYETKVYSGHL